MEETNTSPFDAMAPRYDFEATDAPINRWLRTKVWSWLAALYPPGSHVLEIGCGTGEDAVWLAQHGVRVTATDASAAMLERAKHKAARLGVTDRLSFKQLDVARAEHWDFPVGAFDGAFSNFGVLNCVADWRPLGTALAGAVRSCGRVGFAVMGPVCAWEIVWHAAHGDFKTASRRWRGQSSALIDGVTLPVYYPSPGRLSNALGKAFRVQRICGLGVFLPPSDVQPVVARRPAIARLLQRVEQLTAGLPVFNRIGDHYWMELCRE